MYKEIKLNPRFCVLMVTHGQRAYLEISFSSIDGSDLDLRDGVFRSWIIQVSGQVIFIILLQSDFLLVAEKSRWLFFSCRIDLLSSQLNGLIR